MDTLICEAVFRNRRETIRKVSFFGRNRNYAVVDQELVTHEVGPKKWVSNVLFQYHVREVVKLYYIGVINKIAYEEGNTQNEPEVFPTPHRPLGSTLGRMA